MVKNVHIINQISCNTDTTHAKLDINKNLTKLGINYVTKECTITKLLKICEQDPDCIIDMFKTSYSYEKCLPTLEIENHILTQNGSVEDGHKYHHLMKDESTDYETYPSVINDEFNSSKRENIIRSNKETPNIYHYPTNSTSLKHPEERVYVIYKTKGN